MPCYSPKQAFYTGEFHPTGGKVIKFKNFYRDDQRDLFLDSLRKNPETYFLIPCGRCKGCRIEYSVQWALRALHESKQYDKNCFVTLTLSPEFVSYTDKGLMTLDRDAMPLFNKRLRKKFVGKIPDGVDEKKWISENGIRTYYCGEYGGKYNRPHYHSLLFNCDFSDKYLWEVKNGYKYYRSPTLEKLWPYGISVIGNLTFMSAAYVARYIQKKQYGVTAEDHYDGRLPEFSDGSSSPAIGKKYFENNWKDIYSTDSVVLLRPGKEPLVKRPPRYYDKQLKLVDPVLYEEIVVKRKTRVFDLEEMTTKRLAAKSLVFERSIEKLIRNLEEQEYAV